MPADELERLADDLERPTSEAQEYPPMRPLSNRDNWSLYLLAEEFDWQVPPYPGALATWPQHAILDFRAIRLARARARRVHTLFSATMDRARQLGAMLRKGML